MKTPLMFITLLLSGSMTISGCSGDNNDVNVDVEIMQDNPENYMPELSPAQQAEIEQTREVFKRRGWGAQSLRPKPDDNSAQDNANEKSSSD